MSELSSPPKKEAPNQKSDVFDRLKRQRDRFMAFAFAGADVLLEIRHDSVVTFCAGASHAMFGMPNDQVVGRPLHNLVSPRDYPLLQEALVRLHKTYRFNHLKVNFSTTQGTTVLADVSGISLPGPSPLYHLAITRRKVVPTTKRPADHKLPASPETARDQFISMVENRFADAQQSGEDYNLTLIDLPDDVFQTMEQGDVENVLQDLENNLRAWSVGGESVGRIDDRKFGIVHEKNVTQQVVEERLGELLNQFELTSTTAIKSSTVDMSSDNLRPEDIDKALVYTINKFAAEKGDSFSIDSLADGYKEAMNEALGKVEFFRATINSPRFIFVFQPIVDLKLWEIHHYEALARIHKDSRYILPATFISFAEDVGVVSEMDMVVCQKAIATLKDDRNLPKKAKLAVNLSGRSIDNPRFIQELINLLASNQNLLPRLLFEVTESSAIRNLEQANDVLQKLRRFGCMVCLDDFGAGSAAFQYLRALDIDFVKIDGSYILDGYHSRNGKPFVRAIAGLCRELKIKTIGEMVEDEQSIRLLQESQVDYAQGYFFSRPLPNVLKLELPSQLSATAPLPRSSE